MNVGSEPDIKPSELRKYLYAEADKRLKDAGFTVFSHKALQGHYELKITDECSGIAGISQNIHCGSLHFSFSVGTRIHEVEKIVDRLRPVSVYEGKHAALLRQHSSTMGTNAGYTLPTPSYTSHIPRTKKHVDSDLAQSIEIVTTAGISYMKKNSSVEEIYHNMKKSGRITNSFSEPIIYILMKKKDEAVQLISKEFLSKTYLSSDDPWRVYGERLLKFVDEYL
jgi:hypothetical protein